MSIVVQKYGGSSLATVDLISKIAKKIVARKEEGHEIVVVVSAMGKTTNNLIESAKEISSSPDKREMDMLLSAGERITMSLLCIQLKELGFDSVSLTGSQAGIITNAQHNDAKVIEVRPFRVEDELNKNKIVVVGGFQGVSYKRDITTLGRGGSDTSAVALAAALDAEYCEIYSDVDGVYSADPNILKDAKHIPELSYQEMQEISSAGAKVLNAQAVEFAKNASIAIYARSSFGSDRETIIRKFDNHSHSGVRSVVYERELVKVRFRSEEKSTLNLEVLEYLRINNLQTKEFHVNEKNTSFLLSYSNIHNLEKVKIDLGELIKDSILIEENVSAVSIIGEGFNDKPEFLQHTINILSENKIEIKGITTTSFRISVLIKREDLEKSVNLLHEKFIL